MEIGLERGEAGRRATKGRESSRAGQGLKA